MAAAEETKKPEEVPETQEKEENGLMPAEELDAEDGTGSKFALVEAKTGEEDEETVWSSKSRAYRFDEGENEWKERGVGEVKFLKSKKDGKCRILMRRDQILKVCVAMNLSEVGPLKSHASSDKAWVLAGMDYSDDEDSTRETICFRFGSVEIAKTFKEKFVECGGPES
ncbi:Ran-binding protein 1-like protein b [Diplonema papillatum]|nr:Ran-binding protein 1-like protein b [Diplonema papillatum]